MKVVDLKNKVRTVLTILLFVSVLGARAEAELFTRTQYLLGTYVNIMIWHDGETEKVEKAATDAFAEIRRIESVFSIYKPDSEISKINREAGGSLIPVSAETFEMLQKAVAIAEETEGAFDITFAGAGKLYDFQSKDPQVPTQKMIDKALFAVGISQLQLDDGNRRASLASAGAKIDLGGFIKGYCVDKASQVIIKQGFGDCIVNAGGDMFVSGKKGKKYWKIGIRNPTGSRDDLSATLSVRDMAVVTSGDYERFFEKDGIRYHHIIDPRTGRPARKCKSVTVLAKKVIDADYLATAVFVLGPEKGLALIEKKSDAQVFIIDDQMKWYFSKGFKKSCSFSTTR